MLKEIFLFFFLISDLFGANPIPPILETQLRNTSAIIHAKYRGSSFKKMPDGTIAKQFSFNVIDSLGIEEERLTKKENFLVTSRWRIWRGKTDDITDKFIFYPGEEVVLFLKKVNRDFEILDQEFGKYKIISENGENFLGFDESLGNPKFDKIKVDDFNKFVSKKFGKGILTDLNPMKLENEKPMTIPKRDISSLRKENYLEDPLILIVFLGILGAIGIKFGRSL